MTQFQLQRQRAIRRAFAWSLLIHAAIIASGWTLLETPRLASNGTSLKATVKAPPPAPPETLPATAVPVIAQAVAEAGRRNSETVARRQRSRAPSETAVVAAMPQSDGVLADDVFGYRLALARAARMVAREKQANMQGRTVIELSLPEKRPPTVSVVESSGDSRVDEAARQLIMTAARQVAAPVALAGTRLLIPVEFTR